MIADNVGDNVGDCAGMAADLFETYGVTAAAAMLLGHILFPGTESMFLYPLLVGAAGIVGSLVAIPFVRIGEPGRGPEPAVMRSMYLGLAIASRRDARRLVFVANGLDRDPGAGRQGEPDQRHEPWLCALLGAIVTGVMMWVTDFYTGGNSRHVIAHRRGERGRPRHQHHRGPGRRHAVHADSRSRVIVLAIALCNGIAGLYGVGIAAMAMLSLAGHRGLDRRLRADHRQRGRHRGDGRSSAARCAR